MNDQANRLRELVRRQVHTARPAQSMAARVITVASGKGGVGKSNFSINLAVQICRLGKRVVIIDADFGLANVEILLGVMPKYTAADVLSGKVSMEDALTMGPMGCMFLSGGSGLLNLCDITESQLVHLVDGFIRLDDLADYIIIDTRAGISSNVLGFIKAANDAVIITTPDPTAIADAYALMKSMRTEISEALEIHLVINYVSGTNEGVWVFDKLAGVVERFLGIKLTLLGIIPYDTHLVRAVRKQQAVSICYPYSDVSQSFARICAKLLDLEPVKQNTIQNFVLKLIGRFGA